MNRDSSQLDRLIIAMPPTTNGDLHVGHMTGAFYAADAYTKYCKSQGEECVYFSTADNNQTYIDTTAKRLSLDSKELYKTSSDSIRSTLSMSGVDIDSFPSPNEEYTQFVRQFFNMLKETGSVEEKPLKIYHCKDSGYAAVESYVKGDCHNCFVDTVGGICENCGHPNDANNLANPYWALDPSIPLVLKTVVTPVFILEKYREQLKLHFNERRSCIRPAVMKLIDELLANPLPDYPLTLPVSYGIPADSNVLQDSQHVKNVLNVWVEMLPGLMFSSEIAARNKGFNKSDSYDSLWRLGQNSEISYFFGHDNTFYSAILHTALLMAFGDRYRLPDDFVANRFYELETEKFSTSRRHVIWVKDLLQHTSADMMRFHLALTNPEFQKTQFSSASMTFLVNSKFAAPWSDLVDSLNLIYTDHKKALQGKLTISPAAKTVIQQQSVFFKSCYEIESFSIQNAAERSWSFLAWIQKQAEEVAKLSVGSDEYVEKVADLYGYVRAFSVFIFPICPGFSRSLLSKQNYSGTDNELAVDTVVPIDWNMIDAKEVESFQPFDYSFTKIDLPNKW